MSDKKIKTIAIVGQGYVGLPLAIAATKSKWRVIGVDNSQERVEKLISGSSPVEDVSNFELSIALNSGKYIPTTDFREISNAEVVIFCVPTPLDSEQSPDLSALKLASILTAPHITENTLVVSESTSYPGTLREIIIPIFEQHFPGNVKKLCFAAAPERVNPGDKTWKMENTPRLVSGIDPKSHELAMEFYTSVCNSVIPVETPEIAEAAKLLENTFRLVNIALINEVAQICATSSIDVNEVIDAASTKPYGFMTFRPGVGVGGHCIPVDPLYLSWWARKNGLTPKVIETAKTINDEMPVYVGKRALKLVNKEIVRARVLIVGVGYKSGIADVRETPVIKLREFLLKEGAEVIWHDSLVHTWNGEVSVPYKQSCDVVIITTAQPDLEIEYFIENDIPVLDCSNTLKHFKGVTVL